MIYFDAAYIAKCYLNEPGAEKVINLASASDGLCSCEVGRLEFVSVLKRHRREGHLTARQAMNVFHRLQEDEEMGVWLWLPVASLLLRSICDRVSRLPKAVPIRAGDALHLGCARENGLTEIYTNDHHMLDCAPFFGLKGVNILDS